MKKRNNLSIFILAAVLMLTQACGPKSEKTSEEDVSTQAAVESPVALTPAEKRAKIENERAAQEERRRIEFEERVKTTPTFTDSEGNIVYNKAEVDPSFDGGNEAMIKYLHDNLKFPEEARKMGIEGTVFVDFTVAPNGAVRNVVVTDSPSEDVDQSFRNEAIRVVTAMPKWVPGSQRGKAVYVRYSLPITFEMI